MHKMMALNAKSMTAIEIAAALPSAPEPEPPVINNVRQLFRPGLEQPHAAAPARIIEQNPPAEDLPAPDYAFWKKAVDDDA